MRTSGSTVNLTCDHGPDAILDTDRLLLRCTRADLLRLQQERRPA